jgi:hypothetical protein
MSTAVQAPPLFFHLHYDQSRLNYTAVHPLLLTVPDKSEVFMTLYHKYKISVDFCYENTIFVMYISYDFLVFNSPLIQDRLGY